MTVFNWKSNFPETCDTCVITIRRLKINGLLFLLSHRDIGLVFWSMSCERKALYPILYILKPSSNGGSRSVLVRQTYHPPAQWPPLTGKPVNELEAGAEQRPGEYLMTKRLWTPLYTTVWLMNAASSQTGLHSTLLGHHLHSCSYVTVWISHDISKKGENV